VGLRVRENPLISGMSLVCGFTGEHAIRRVEAAAVAPYPLAADLRLNGVWLSDAPHQATIGVQAYDFSCAELSSELKFDVGDTRARLEVVTFCDRVEPTLVCQDISLVLNTACDVAIRSIIDATMIEGRALRYLRDTPGEKQPACDGALLWEGAGGLSTCGLAYITELLGAGDVPGVRPPFDRCRLSTQYSFRARAGRRYRLRQLVTIVPNQMHFQPDYQAVRLVALAHRRGFKNIQNGNREVWSDLWKGGIALLELPLARRH
jgi:trehalose/maltose hydrolase-like predicted phosphorylase